jgi:hypothetical protein
MWLPGRAEADLAESHSEDYDAKSRPIIAASYCRNVAGDAVLWSRGTREIEEATLK